MCSLCGVLGGRVHWTETTGDSASAGGVRPTLVGQRQLRARLVDRVLAHYGLTLRDWPPASYVLRSHTGRTALVAHLAELWSVADTLSRKPCDPLDPELLRAIGTDPGETAGPARGGR